MGRFIQYLGLVMAAIYILFGLYLLLGVYIVAKPMVVPNGNIFGGLLIGYGLFRIYRFMQPKQA